MIRLAVIGIIVSLVGLALAVATTSLGYVLIASQLPPSSELRERASTFETAQILDREGGVLYSLEDPNAGNRSYVPLSQISQELQKATIATEDSRFYTNPGFDPAAIGRAIIRAAQEGEGIYGTSTITQQLARALLLDEDERTQRTFSRKVKEIILAAEIFRTYEKDEILELYLNEINYGNRAYGIEAAAETYFNKPAADLTLAEASLLAGLPQAPAFWDPFTSPEDALGRQQVVLGLMVDNNYITPAESQAAMDASAPVVRAMEPPDITIRHPHFTVTVLQQLEAEIGARWIRPLRNWPSKPSPPTGLLSTRPEPTMRQWW
jgi:membrane peptidoglycan carboxypeptidase